MMLMAVAKKQRSYTNTKKIANLIEKESEILSYCSL